MRNLAMDRRGQEPDGHWRHSVNRLRERSDIRGDVFLKESAAIEQHGDHKYLPSPSKADMSKYMSEQLQAAENTTDLKATLKPIAELHG